MIKIVKGNIVDFEDSVDVIVNAWNRNFIPHRILVTHGVSKAIKERSDLKPFDEVQKFGFLKLGEAVLTTPGKLNCKGIMHVAGIDIFWNSSEKATRLSAKNIVKIVLENDFKSIAVPLIGCGTNKLDENKCIEILKEEFEIISDRDMFVVKYENN